MKKIGLLLLITCFSLSINAQIKGQVRLTPQDVQIVQDGEFVNLFFENSLLMEKVGFPQMPYITRSYVVPIDAEVTGISISSLSLQKRDGSFYIYPAQPNMPISKTNASSFVDLDNKICVNILKKIAY